MLDAHFVCCMMQKIYVNLYVPKIILTHCCVTCNFGDSRYKFDCGCRLKTDMGKCTWKLLSFKGFYTCTILLSQPLWDNSSASKWFFTSISKRCPRKTKYLVKMKLVLLHWIWCCAYITRRIEDGEAIVRSACSCNCGLADFDWQLGFSRSSTSFSIFPHLYYIRFLVAKWYESNCSHPQKLRLSHLLTVCFCCGWFKADSLPPSFILFAPEARFKAEGVDKNEEIGAAVVVTFAGSSAHAVSKATGPPSSSRLQTSACRLRTSTGYSSNSTC